MVAGFDRGRLSGLHRAAAGANGILQGVSGSCSYHATTSQGLVCKCQGTRCILSVDKGGGEDSEEYGGLHVELMVFRFTRTS